MIKKMDSLLKRLNNADASFYYHEDATADIARMDSSAVHGNLADAMKNATALVQSPEIIRMIMASPPCLENDKQGLFLKTAQ